MKAVRHLTFDTGNRRDINRCQDEVSLNEVSLNMYYWNQQSHGQLIPGQCVPSLDRIQAVENHNSYSQKLRFPWVTWGKPKIRSPDPAHERIKYAQSSPDPTFPNPVTPTPEVWDTLVRDDLSWGLKGTVSRDFLLLVFFMNQFPPSPRVFH